EKLDEVRIQVRLLLRIVQLDVALPDVVLLVDDDGRFARLRLAAAARRWLRRLRDRGRGREQCEDDEAARLPEHEHQCKPRCFITSPRRKIDPATTIRRLGDCCQAASSARDSDGSTSTASEGAMRVATAARSTGSAERGFSARVTIRLPTAGTSARNIPPASLSRIAAKTSGTGSRCSDRK